MKWASFKHRFMTEGHISGENGTYHCDPQGEYFLKIYTLLKYRGNTAGVFLVRRYLYI